MKPRSIRILPPLRKTDGPRQYTLTWTGPQAEFINDWTHTTQYECCGVGWGKTVTGAAKALACALRWPGCTVGCFEPTGKMLDTVMYPAFLEVLETFKAINGFDPVRKRVNYTSTWTLFNGSKLQFFSAHKPERIVGATLGAAWLDEESSYESPDELITKVRARLRGRGPGILWATSTPNGRIGLIAQIQDELANLPEGARPRSIIRTHPTHENAHNLPPDFIAQLQRTYSKALYEQEVLALVGASTNLVYGGFQRATHCRAFDRRALKGGWDICIGLDWSGGAKEGAIVWCAVQGQGEGKLPKLVILDEWVGVASNARMIQLVKESLNRYPTLPSLCAPDPADFDGVADLRKELKQILRKGIVRWESEPRRRRVPYGVELVNRLIASAEGEQAFLVDAPLLRGNPHGVVEALEHYRLKGGKIYDDNTYTHILDALRYVVLNLHRIGYKIRGAKLPDGTALRQSRREEDDDDGES